MALQRGVYRPREEAADVHEAAASGAASVRVWEVMSRGRRPRGRCPSPEGVDVAYPPDQLIQAVDKLGFRASLKAGTLEGDRPTRHEL